MKKLLSCLFFILLPAFTQAAEVSGASNSQVVQTTSAEQKINLNTADAETLQRELSGIGAVKAQAIVDYREQHGNFASADELLEVKGIGQALFEKNRDRLSVH